MQAEIDYDAIKRTVSISDVLSRYTRVFHRNKYRIPCILHQGEGYNLAIDEDRGLWHCFRCDQGGDVISLLAKLENISNAEAAKRLADEYRVSNIYGQRSFRSALDDARRWEPKGPLPEVALPLSSPLNGYRRFSADAIQHFHLQLVPTGVLTPFLDVSGRVVGYSIRQINREPKYMNSKDLRKSEIVYGLHENREAILKDRTAIICEGQFSAIRVWDTGYKNVVATLGSTMSPAQAHLLGYYADKLILLYDGDEAGRNGAAKVREVYSSLFKIETVTLPQGKDPDDADLEILNVENKNDRMESNWAGAGDFQ